jgi:hypothetical protein
MSKRHRFLTREEAADEIRLSVRQLDRLVAEGKLKKVKLSASRAGIPRKDLDRYIQLVEGREPDFCIVALPDKQYAAAVRARVIADGKEIDLVIPLEPGSLENAVDELSRRQRLAARAPEGRE